MTTTDANVAPLVKTTTVPQDLSAAFELFTAHFGRWWPRATHSVGELDATSVTFGRAVGDAIIETINGAADEAWGTITVWEPPSRVAFSWHPGSPEAEATTVEVIFAVAEEGTQVTLTHSGWQNRPDALSARSGYDSGWDFVLGCYATQAST